MENSVTILSSAGLGMAMFSLGKIYFSGSCFLIFNPFNL